jgi:hypothetical protein
MAVLAPNPIDANTTPNNSFFIIVSLVANMVNASVGGRLLLEFR